MNRLGDFPFEHPSKTSRRTWRPHRAGWKLAVVLSLGLGLTFTQAWAQNAEENSYLITAPQIRVQAPSLAQNETPLWIDLDRDAPGTQLSILADPGDVIRASLVIGGYFAHRGYSAQVLVSPPEAVPSVLAVDFSPGDLIGSGVRTTLGGNADAIGTAAGIFLQDAVLPDLAINPDIDTYPSTLFGFDIPIGPSPGNLITLHIVEQNEEGLPPESDFNRVIYFPEPFDPDNSFAADIMTPDFVLTDARVITGALPTPTPVVITGSMTLNEDLLIAANETYVLMPGAELLFRAYVDENNKGRYPTLSELIVEGTLRVEGFEGGNVPVQIGPDYTPLTPTPTATPQFVAPVAPYYQFTRTIDEIQGATSIAPNLADLDGDGMADLLYYGESEGRVFVSMIGGEFGVVSPPQPVAALGSGSAAAVLAQPQQAATPAPVSILAATESVGFVNSSSFPIPDDDPTGATSTITVVGNREVVSLTVPIDLTHADPSQLSISLTSPLETLVFLSFLDLSSSVQHVTGEYGVSLPVSGPGSLTDYTGENAQGDWTLAVYDTTVSGTGTVNLWGLNMVFAATETATPTPTLPPPPTATPTPVGAMEIDVGNDSVPYLVDADGDGKVDLFVGGEDGLVRAYQNIAPGATDTPQFRQISDDYLYYAEGIVIAGTREPVQFPGGVAPALGDLNGDGIIDLIIGNTASQVIYLEGYNGGSPEDFFSDASNENRLFIKHPLTLNETGFTFLAAESSGATIPSLVDYDDDGDLDVIAGRGDGYLRLWESRLAEGEYVYPFEDFPQFEFAVFPRLVFFDRFVGLINEAFDDGQGFYTFGKVNVGARAAPAQSRLLGDDRVDLLAGSDSGTLFLFENITSQVEAALFRKPSAKVASSAQATSTRDSPGIDTWAPWGGIWFKDSSRDDQSKIENAVIFDAQVGIRAEESSPRILSTSILNSRQYGILAEDMAFPYVQDVNIASHSNQSIAGVLADRYSAPTLQSVSLWENGRYGLLTRRFSYPIVRGAPGDLFRGHSIISGNQYGVRIESDSAPRLGDVNNTNPNDDGLNEIFDNVFYDIYNNTPARIKAENNLWKTSDLAAIDRRLYDDDENPLKGVIDFVPLARITLDPVETPTPTPTSRYIQRPTAVPTPSPVIPAISVSGDITEPTVWQGEILVVDDVTVKNGAVLEIKPGTVVRFREQQPLLEIRAESSTIFARGTRAEPIVFVPETYVNEDPQPGDFDAPYAGIVLDGPCLDPSVFEFCEFRFADIGLNMINCTATVDHCEFVVNRQALRVVASGTTYPSEWVNPRVRYSLFDLNEAVLQLIGNAAPDLGDYGIDGATDDDPGMNSFIFPDDDPSRFDFQVTNYTAPDRVVAQGNYFLLREGNSTRRLTAITDLQPRFSPGALAVAFSVFPVGPLLVDDWPHRPGIQLAHPEVWAGSIELLDDVEIFSSVDILPGSEVIARFTPDRQIIVASGTILPATTYRPAVVLDGVLRAHGRPSLPILFYSQLYGNAAGSWGGLRFSGESSQGPSVLQNCFLSGGLDQIVAVGASLRIEGCAFRDYLDAAVHALDIIYQLDDEWFCFASECMIEYEDEGRMYVPRFSYPLGITAPYLYNSLMFGGDFGVLSENSRPVIRLCEISSTRVAGVFALGPNLPNLGANGDPGNNAFVTNEDFALVNNSNTRILAFGNYWQSSLGNVLDNANDIDQVILDDDENSAAGAVEFSGFLLYKPPLITHKGDVVVDNMVDQQDLRVLIRSWHSIIGQRGRFNERVDFDRNRVINYKDLFYHSTRWHRSGLDN